jgi:tRNA G10  N-methylase Trm11
MNYFFVPGRKWLLAQAELHAVLQQRNLRYVELSSNEHVLLYDIMAEQQDIVSLFRRLGGSVKAGILVDDPFEFLSRDILPQQNDKKEKLNFALSFYDEVSRNKSILEQRNKLGMEIKKWLREKHISSRFVSRYSMLETSAVLVKTNHILDKGFEINRFVHPRTAKTIWGVTLDNQDYEGFAKRDYDRPRVNKRRGMIPPKLARIMVNLAQVPDGGTVWDPFCGSGTILMEALVLGYRVIGSDVDLLAVEETTENLHWASEEYWVSHSRYNIFEHDVHDALSPDMHFDAVVTETYLGPVIQRKVSVDQVNELNNAIQPLFDSLGNEIERQVRRERHGKIVAVVPGFRSSSGWIDMHGTFEHNPLISRVEPKRIGVTEPLQWDRPNSIIRRNISQFSY